MYKVVMTADKADGFIDSYSAYDKSSVIHLAPDTKSPMTLCGKELKRRRHRFLINGVSGREVAYIDCPECLYQMLFADREEK
jgi:hypothetical protein